MDRDTIEAEVRKRGLDKAPRITPADIDAIDAEIVATEYHVFAGSCTTVCCATLQNGFTVTGESACVSPENFDAELGREVALARAKEKLWPLLAFRLRDQLAARQRWHDALAASDAEVEAEVEASRRRWDGPDDRPEPGDLG